ncbi:protein of unknown function DUF114 [Methanosalsum zhilinae DSM 4017]|uniref:Peptidase S49 n=1 Tax=Methanosalsum zhilinae (strain DSM 4017 / NBRC 107636 / OCM 62 / WeN5) TaxID=679901 RepID=F7XLN2_METZD|nr:ATP-dependent Clp protease proteolytic subunit [Methanosalsum zhilinae]AEH60855.1 protein of unknown function DUF114 [Methanosalsum zhilinae DSM 4017]
MVFEDISIWNVLTVLMIIFVAYLLIYPQLQLRGIKARRLRVIKKLEKSQGTKVLTMVHRKEALSLFGVPIYQYIDSDDAEQIIKGIRETGKRPIDLIIHTPGGQMHSSIQIARALKNHSEPTRVIIPYYSMSGGTIIALAADEILMDPHAVIGPIDPQIGDFIRGTYPAPSWIYAANKKGVNAEDSTIIMSDISQKAMNLTGAVVHELLSDRFEDQKKLKVVADKLFSGELIHITPIKPSEAIELGLPVKTEIPGEVYEFMNYFRYVKASVEYL